MLEVKKEGVLISKTDLIFENEGVLNPGVIRDGEFVHLFYRAVSNGNNSSIGYCKLKGPLTVVERFEHAIIVPEFDYEMHGVEDPRIVKIEDTYYLTYTAYDGINALGALATSVDLVHWEKKGLLAPQITYNEFKEIIGAGKRSEKYTRFNEHERVVVRQDETVFLWDKNIIFFPRKIDGKLFFLHRIKPDVQIVLGIRDLSELTPAFWRNNIQNIESNTVLSPRFEHESSYLGGGCPPVETEHGWLLIYHGVQDTSKGYVYSACAALLDLQNPQKEIGRLPYPLFFPEFKWELKGEVNNVCFPTGTVLFGDKLYIYYGAADERIAVVSLSLSAIIQELLLNKTK